MKKFTFGLEKILSLREWAEKEARTELGRAVSALTEIERLLAQNEAARRGAAPPGGAGVISINALLVYGNYTLRLDTEKEALLARKSGAEEAVEAAREKWQAAASEKKALENVQKRRQKEYRKTVLLEEEKEADDSAQTHPPAQDTRKAQ